MSKLTKKQLEQFTSNYDDYLLNDLTDSDNAIHYLQAALEAYQKDNQASALLLALRHIADAQGGVGELAKKTKLNRENLYRTLSSKGNPRLNTFGVLLRALGFQLSIKKLA